jgi:hypothetical protein
MAGVNLYTNPCCKWHQKPKHSERPVQHKAKIKLCLTQTKIISKFPEKFKETEKNDYFTIGITAKKLFQL